MLTNSRQLLGNPVRRENQIHAACSKGALGHTIVLGRFFVLGESNAPSPLIAANPKVPSEAVPERITPIALLPNWYFQSEFCTPGEAHEKGGVEGEGGYFRRNHWVPMPEARNLEELNAYLR